MTQPVSSVALIDGIDVDAVAAAVTACPGVSGLYGGRGDAIASYLPGRRVAGVEVKAATVTVHVRSRWGVTAAQLLTQIATAVSPLLHGHRLEVVVADIDETDPPARQATPAGAPTPPPAPVTGRPTVDATAAVGPPGTSPEFDVRPPGSSPAPTAPSPKPAPPTFPTV